MTKQQKSRVFLLYCLTVVVSGSIPLTNDSVSERPKNLRNTLKFFFSILVPEYDLLTTLGNGSGGEQGSGDQSNIAAPNN
jgi:hypothetical protein